MSNRQRIPSLCMPNYNESRLEQYVNGLAARHDGAEGIAEMLEPDMKHKSGRPDPLAGSYGWSDIPGPEHDIRVPASSGFSFCSFCLLPTQRLLLDGNQPVRIGGRALDLLTALVEQAGEILTKQELISRVWPRVTVEEGNLKVQIRTLRRVLGDCQSGPRFIVTVPGHGYTFVVQVTRQFALADRVACSEYGAGSAEASCRESLPSPSM